MAFDGFWCLSFCVCPLITSFPLSLPLTSFDLKCTLYVKTFVSAAYLISILRFDHNAGWMEITRALINSRCRGRWLGVIIQIKYPDTDYKWLCKWDHKVSKLTRLHMYLKFAKASHHKLMAIDDQSWIVFCSFTCIFLSNSLLRSVAT